MREDWPVGKPLYSMERNRPVRPSEEDCEIVRQELELIVILHHRNKNQHHGATWFKYLNILKSSLSRMVAIPRPVNSDKPSKAQRRANTEYAALWEQESELFRCRTKPMYLAFTQIIGTGQYVALGMVLLGTLSRIYRALQCNEVDTLLSIDSDFSSENFGLSLPRSIDHDVADTGVLIRRAPDHGSEEVRGKASTEEVIGQPDGPGRPLAIRNPDAVSFIHTASSLSPTVLKRANAASSAGMIAKERKRKKKKALHQGDEIDSIFG